MVRTRAGAHLEYGVQSVYGVAVVRMGARGVYCLGCVAYK